MNMAALEFAERDPAGCLRDPQPSSLGMPSPGMPLRHMPIALSNDQGEVQPCFISTCDLSGEDLEHAARQLLSPAETARLARAAHPRRRISFLRGRVAAKQALAGLCRGRVPAHAFEITAGVFEQPVVKGPESNLGITLSHSDQLAVAVAFPESHPLGVDLESVSAAHATTLREQMTPGELQRVALPGLPEAELLTLLWGAKEAVSKVLRGGLAVDFHALQVARAGWRDGIAELGFSSFAHLRAEAVVAGGQVLALAVPARCSLQWDGNLARSWLLACAQGR